VARKAHRLPYNWEPRNYQLGVWSALERGIKPVREQIDASIPFMRSHALFSSSLGAPGQNASTRFIAIRSATVTTQFS
jgi:hypothetical protein